MPEFNCDLHYHGPYAGGVSKNMSIPLIAEQAQLKGLDVVVTADSTHKDWLQHCKENLVETENGVYKHEKFNTIFLVGTEVQDQTRVHHLIYLEDLTRAQELREKLLPFGNLDHVMAGRPQLQLNPEKLAEIVEKVGGIVGPTHSFTPYFGVYAHYDSVEKAYGQFGRSISFIELGLSADSYFADLIPENHQYNFFTFSDSHSPWPHRIGREFTKIKMKKPDFNELKKALERKGENKITLNAGLNPREGKYHATACNLCYHHFSLQEMRALNWKCPHCNGTIKRGVRDRIMELAKGDKTEKHPDFRPPYQHLLPLAEIIQLTVGGKDPTLDGVQRIWKEFVNEFGNEIRTILDTPVAELETVHKEVAHSIDSFRKGWVAYYPGGGGKYGAPFIAHSVEELNRLNAEIEKGILPGAIKQKTPQKKLGDFG
jgi:uncharacterized protein (TIGR00375 family)